MTPLIIVIAASLALGWVARCLEQARRVAIRRAHRLGLRHDAIVTAQREHGRAMSARSLEARRIVQNAERDRALAMAARLASSAPSPIAPRDEVVAEVRARRTARKLTCA